MKIKSFALLCCLLLSSLIHAQTAIPAYYEQDQNLSDSLQAILVQLDLDQGYDVDEDEPKKVSIAVIDLNGEKPLIGGVNMEQFIYPASVYKMYVAMEILKQVREGKYSLYESYVVKSPNDVDKSKEISNDPRPLLRDGDTVTVKYLLDLMITRSDNSAANCLIDIAGRPNINKTMLDYGWKGSEVTRKFLSIKLEDPDYTEIRGTDTNALHAADFMYKVETETLVNPWVSMQLKTLLGGQLDISKLEQGLPRNAMFYHKSGWWSYYTNDVGIVDDGEIKYVISVFTPITEEEVKPKLKELSKRVYQLVKGRN